MNLQDLTWHADRKGGESVRLVSGTLDDSSDEQQGGQEWKAAMDALGLIFASRPKASIPNSHLSVRLKSAIVSFYCC